MTDSEKKEKEKISSQTGGKIMDDETDEEDEDYVEGSGDDDDESSDSVEENDDPDSQKENIDEKIAELKDVYAIKLTQHQKNAFKKQRENFGWDIPEIIQNGFIIFNNEKKKLVKIDQLYEKVRKIQEDLNTYLEKNEATKKDFFLFYCSDIYEEAKKEDFDQNDFIISFIGTIVHILYDQEAERLELSNTVLEFENAARGKMGEITDLSKKNQINEHTIESLRKQLNDLKSSNKEDKDIDKFAETNRILTENNKGLQIMMKELQNEKRLFENEILKLKTDNKNLETQLKNPATKLNAIESSDEKTVLSKKSSHVGVVSIPVPPKTTKKPDDEKMTYMKILLYSNQLDRTTKEMVLSKINKNNFELIFDLLSRITELNEKNDSVNVKESENISLYSSQRKIRKEKDVINISTKSVV